MFYYITVYILRFIYSELTMCEFVLPSEEYKNYVIMLMKGQPTHQPNQRVYYSDYKREYFVDEIKKLNDLRVYNYVHKILINQCNIIDDANALEYYYIGRTYTIFFDLPEKEKYYYSLSVNMGDMRGIDRLIELYKKENNYVVLEKYLSIAYEHSTINNEPEKSKYYFEGILQLIEKSGDNLNHDKSKYINLLSKYITENVLNSDVEYVKKMKDGNQCLSFEKFIPNCKVCSSNEKTIILLKTVTETERYDIIERYDVSLKFEYIDDNADYLKIIKSNIFISSLLPLMDAYTDEDMLKVIYSIKPENINKHPKFIQTIHKLLHSNIDPMKLHFEYSMQGKGFEDAKADYYKYLSNRQSNPQ